ncbi:MAG: hypothetical protein KAW01_03515 [Deltaproteobacteria bacterium]|nr:hypothetical protein [Deltaproteobacteria bacterium]
MAQNHQEPIKSEDLSEILEPLIRRVVREELTRISQRQSNISSLDPGMPIYKDMQELKNKKRIFQESGSAALFPENS